MVRGVGAVEEIHVHVVDAVICESLGIVVAFVQANNQRDISLLEVRHVVVRAMGVITTRRELAISVRTGECDELAIQHPVQISIFNLFEVLVLFDVEVVEVEKAMFTGFLQPA